MNNDNLLKWCVTYKSGIKRYFWCEETAKIECLQYGGISIRPPLYSN